MKETGLRLDMSARVCYLHMYQTILFLHLPQSAIEEGEHQAPDIQGTFHATLPSEFSNPKNGIVISGTKEGYPSHLCGPTAWL